MGAGGDSVAPPPLDNWVDPRSVARKERMERIAARKSRKAFLARRLEQELKELCPPKKVAGKKFYDAITDKLERAPPAHQEVGSSDSEKTVFHCLIS